MDTELIRAVCPGHPHTAVFDLTDIGIVDFDDLVFGERVGAEFLSVHGNTDCLVAAFLEIAHGNPKYDRQNQNSQDKVFFFFLQVKVPSVIMIYFHVLPCRRRHMDKNSAFIIFRKKKQCKILT